MAERLNVIVIGGGAIGCGAAYYLSKQGCQVRILEANHVGRGCSHGNCGFICPSHALPLTAPGAIRRVVGGMFDKDSALYVKPTLNPALLSWLLRFALKCQSGHMMKAAKARQALLTSSMELYRRLQDEESLDIEWENRGLLFIYKSEHEFAAYGKIADLLRRELGIEMVAYAGNRLIELEPALRDNVAGGWHCPTDSHLRPDRLMSAMANTLRNRGVEILEEVSVHHFDVNGSAARRINTSAGPMTADLYILASGAEAAFFASQLGCRIPIQPAKGYSITMAQSDRAIRYPMIFEESHVAVTPWASGVRVGSTMEFVGYDRSINPRRIELFQRVVAERLVAPPAGPILEEWSGWRPMTYDELPCIGRVPRIGNVIIATGHGMLGISMMTATGKLVSELALEVEPHIDPAPYSLTRF